MTNTQSLIREEKGLFTIQTKNSTYQMKVGKFGYLLHLYYGKKMTGDASFLIFEKDRGFSPNPHEAGNDTSFSLDYMPQEFPVRGNGDFRSPAFDVRYSDTSWGLDLRYKDFKIKDEKYGLQGMPAMYDKELVANGTSATAARAKNSCSPSGADFTLNPTPAQTLEITLEDKVAKLEVTLLYGVFYDIDVITRAAIVKNTGPKTFTIEKLQPAVLDFVTGNYDFIKFYGRHNMERSMQRTPIGHCNQSIYSRRGTSSHQYNPLMIIAEGGDCPANGGAAQGAGGAGPATETTGSCWGLQFVWSGGFKGEAEKSQFNGTRVQLGLMDEGLSYPVAQGEVFYSPEVIMTYAPDGLNHLSQNFHKAIKNHICRGIWRDAKRPVLINSWEANYFDLSKDSIEELARQAAPLGIELLVMDDGWFGKRDNDHAGLGDWFVNEKKLGCSLKELVKAVNDTGMKFGLWIEPEMVNEASDFYRAHPDYAMIVPGRKPVHGRHQLMLDFSRKEVVDTVFDQICKVIDSANIEYVKWDFNRSINDVFSASTANQGKVLYDFVKGTYDLAERFLKRYPKILFEGCSGGGGRFDAGMLYYTPQIWCSDNTDAIDRACIQYGTSFGYPLTTAGSHVSIVPNHQTSRITPINTRFTVAMCGAFGYELNLTKVNDDEKKEIKAQITEYHKYSGLFKNGDYYRLINPFDGSLAAWAIISPDKSETLVCAVQLEMHGNMTDLYVPVYGLNPYANYKDEATGQIYPGAVLVQLGLPVPATLHQYDSYKWHLFKIEEDSLSENDDFQP